MFIMKTEVLAGEGRSQAGSERSLLHPLGSDGRRSRRELRRICTGSFQQGAVRARLETCFLTAPGLSCKIVE